MQIIIKNQANQLCVTVSEKTTLESPNYLFVFKHEEENVNYSCILPNTSIWERYGLFSFTEGVDATLRYTGDYVLKVYEQTSPSNLDPLLAYGIVHVEESLLLNTPFDYTVKNPNVIRDINEIE